MSTSRNLAVIPARGGSKRIPRKNIKKLGDLPMIAYSIQAALESGVFEQVIVSTDDSEIADIAKQYGASIPFIRKQSLADDHTPASLVSLDALEQVNESFDRIAQLMPNCPFRNAEDIKRSYAQFAKQNADTQLSVTRYGWLNPWWAMKQNDAKLEPLFPEALKQRSQDLDELYCPTGAIWWAKTSSLKEHKTFYAPNYTGFELSWQHALDIDDEDDWLMAEVLLALKGKSS